VNLGLTVGTPYSPTSTALWSHEHTLSPVIFALLGRTPPQMPQSGRRLFLQLPQHGAFTPRWALLLLMQLDSGSPLELKPAGELKNTWTCIALDLPKCTV
jgi:hypothetical protein